MRYALLAIVLIALLSPIAGWTVPRAPQVDAGSCPLPLYMGDLNGSQHITSTDALWILRDTAGLFLPGDGQGCSPLDVDCSGSANAIDALKILRHIAGLEVGQFEPCQDIGTTLPL
jgi:hypothetical protein